MTLAINAAELDGIKALHQIFAEGLGFPDYYGGNFDALHDCLTDIAEDTEILIENAALLPEKIGERRAKTLRRLLFIVSEENPRVTVTVTE